MKSKFTGGLLGLIGITLLELVIIIFTLGIGTPWAVCKRSSWIARHTVIDGYTLTFDGTGAQLFGTYIKWVFLTIITVGIFALWLPLRMQNWLTKHTHIVPNA